MASNTENLGLLKKNPSTDGADTFNIQTMLNDNWDKLDANAGTVAQTLANILKPTTPPIIGLPPSTTPDGMFQALGNTGELHVWRKTVKNAEDVPAGYTLGEVQNVTKYPITDVRSGGYTIVTKAYSNLSVDDAGNVSVDESSYVNFYDNASAVRGKFIQVYSDGDILFIPNDANISTDYKTVGYVVIHNHYTDKYQTVTGYPLTPAGTTTTYPVSTNPNAYQEGDDAKEAGYTLGEVVMGSFRAGATNYTISYNYEAASELTVSDDGRTVSMTSPSTGSFGFMGGLEPGDDPAKIRAFMLGKFVRCTAKGDQLNEAPDTKYPFNTIPSDIVYIPSNAQITMANGDVLVDRYQPVTGYAAIPAGTTIEYLGKLGDKARVQVLSYVGTGTYGSSNPNSLTFDFVPKLVIIRANGAANVFIYTLLFLAGTLTKTFQENGYVNLIGDSEPGLSDAYARVSGRTLAWYSVDSYNRQANYKGAKYTAIAIG